MATEKNVLGSTRLLIEALTQVHKEIFANSQIDDQSKAHEIACVISLALEEINEFSCYHDRFTVDTINEIKSKFKGDLNEKKVNTLCDNILKLTISSNKYFLTYGNVLGKIEAAIEATI